MDELAFFLPIMSKNSTVSRLSILFVSLVSMGFSYFLISALLCFQWLGFDFCFYCLDLVFV